jgi:cyclin A
MWPLHDVQVREFSYITDNTYTKDEIKIMERWIWRALRFELTAPTARLFLRRFVKASAADWPESKIWRCARAPGFTAHWR